MLWLNLSHKFLIRLIILIAVSVSVAFAYNAIYTKTETGPFYFKDTAKRQVAFSFEVAWGEGCIEEILQVLEEADVKSSFFISGSWLTRYPRESEKILLKGHEIGKQSYSAIPYTQLTQEEISGEFARFNELTGDLLEYRSELFRPPAGVYNELIINVAKRYGFSTVLWSIDANDYMAETDEELTDRIAVNLHYGAIIKFCTGSENIPEALQEVISYIRECGYEIVRVSDLIK